MSTRREIAQLAVMLGMTVDELGKSDENSEGILCSRCGQVAQGGGWDGERRRLCHGSTRDCYTIVTSHYTPQHHIEPEV